MRALEKKRNTVSLVNGVGEGFEGRDCNTIHHSPPAVPYESAATDSGARPRPISPSKAFLRPSGSERPLSVTGASRRCYAYLPDIR
jgi:hypothetical protein